MIILIIKAIGMIGKLIGMNVRMIILIIPMIIIIYRAALLICGTAFLIFTKSAKILHAFFYVRRRCLFVYIWVNKRTKRALILSYLQDWGDKIAPITGYKQCRFVSSTCGTNAIFQLTKFTFIGK